MQEYRIWSFDKNNTTYQGKEIKGCTGTGMLLETILSDSFINAIEAAKERYPNKILEVQYNRIKVRVPENALTPEGKIELLEAINQIIRD